jgi:hypothetical protein
VSYRLGNTVVTEVLEFHILQSYSVSGSLSNYRSSLYGITSQKMWIFINSAIKNLKFQYDVGI